MLMPAATYHLGEVLAQAGRDSEAVEAFRKFRRWPEWDNNWGGIGAAWPRSLYLEALSLERLGERDKAIQNVDRLLALWKRADSDLPTLRDAKALRARLVAER
jgi:tetratricopeptide (TPR) repeat protein